MNTAVKWERENAIHLEAMIIALADKDRYTAEDILNTIAPFPKGENVIELEGSHDTQHKRLTKVVNPHNGGLDNPDGPAVVEGDGTRKWYRANMLHNAHGPAVIKANGKLKYYYLGKRFRTAEQLDEAVSIAEQHFKKTKHCHNTSA